MDEDEQISNTPLSGLEALCEGIILAKLSALLEMHVRSERELEFDNGEKFKLIEQLGSGGNGIVFLARQARLPANKVALKFLLPGTDIVRGTGEIIANAQLRHPHIARVHGCWTWRIDDEGAPIDVPVIEMEFVEDARPIATLVMGEAVNLHHVVAVFVGLLKTLSEIHCKGVIHGDIKPANLLVFTYHGTDHIKILDFGEAQVVDVRRSVALALLNDQATGVQRPLKGTHGYSPPEFYKHIDNPVDVVTPRSDLFSVGAVLWELLTGEQPYGGRVSVFKAESAPPVTFVPASNIHMSSELREALGQVLLESLAWDPKQRYASANEMARALSNSLRPKPRRNPPPPARTERKWLWSTIVLFTGIAVLLALYGISSWALSGHDAKPNTEISRNQETGGSAPELPNWVAELEQHCDEGDADSCRELAGAHRDDDDDGIASDVEKELHYEDKACDLRDGPACFRVGQLRRGGEEMYPDPEGARDAFERGCDARHGLSCASLADYHRTGTGGVPKDVDRAAGLSATACELDSCWGCVAQGDDLRLGRGNVQPNAGLARTKYERACDVLECDENGDYGCSALADMYRNGAGGEHDVQQAIKYYDKSCTHTYTDQPQGCEALADIYWLGELGVQENRQESLRYLSLGCTRHKSPALCREIADVYWYGNGIHRDRGEAVNFAVEGCELDDSIACRRLSMMYAVGMGVDIDHDRAREYSDKALAIETRTCKFRSSNASGDLSSFESWACSNMLTAAQARDNLPWSTTDLDIAEAATIMTELCARGVPEACRWVYATYVSGLVSPPVGWQREAALNQVEAALGQSCSNSTPATDCLSAAVTLHQLGRLDDEAFSRRVQQIREVASVACEEQDESCSRRIASANPWAEESRRALEQEWDQQARDCRADLARCAALGEQPNPQLSRARLVAARERWEQSCATRGEQRPFSSAWYIARNDCIRVANTILLTEADPKSALESALPQLQTVCAEGYGCVEYAEVIQALRPAEPLDHDTLERLEEQCFWAWDIAACAWIVDRASTPERMQVAAQFLTPQCEAGIHWACPGWYRGVEQDRIGYSRRTVTLEQAYCEVGLWYSCAGVGEAPYAEELVGTAELRAQHVAKAEATLTWSCLLGDENDCATLAISRIRNSNATTDAQRWRDELRRTCAVSLFDDLAATPSCIKEAISALESQPTVDG